MSDDLTASSNHVVHFYYHMHGEDGEIAESSRSEPHPAAVQMGHDNLMPGLEKALEGKRAGDTFDVVIPPEDAFGTRRDDWNQRVSKKYIPGAARLKAGAMAQIQTDHGVRVVTVLKVGGKFVDVDLNHPMAGQSVNIAVEVTDVRAATDEELAHGHVHGAGGHHHQKSPGARPGLHDTMLEDVDLNHPMAGQSVNIAVEVTDVR
ncbi:MAG: peptidylprolyl isomerase, partial [Pseudomonadota bacterium]